MVAHRFWQLSDLSAPAGGGYFGMAECYLRSVLGAGNFIPTASAASSSFSSGFGPANTYDGDPNNAWVSAGNDNPTWIAYDYGVPISPVEIVITARNNGQPEQAPIAGNIYYSDVSLGGPWTLWEGFTFDPWTNGETQTFGLVPEPQLNVSTQEAMVALSSTTEGLYVSVQEPMVGMSPPASALDVSVQEALLSMMTPADSIQVAEQVVMVAMVQAPPPAFVRRRSYFVM